MMGGSSPLDHEVIVNAAAHLIDSEGTDALTMSRIAAELGVTQPALYRHIDGIADLWRSLGLRTRADLATNLTMASVGLSGSDAVRAAADEWRRYGTEHPGCYRSTERFAVANDPELETAVKRVIDVLVLCLRGFGLDDDEAVHCARALRSALHGFVTFELGDGHPAPLDADVSFDHLVDLLCSAYEAKAIAQKASAA